MTGWTLLAGSYTASATGLACCGKAHSTSLDLSLACSPAHRTCGLTATLNITSPRACFARDHASQLNPSMKSVNGIVEAHLHPVMDILSPGNLRNSLPSGSSEDVLEKISKGWWAKTRKIESLEWIGMGTLLAWAGRDVSDKSELIVLLSLPRITQDGIGLLYLLEFMLCSLITRIEVRMEFSSEFPVAFFNFCRGSLLAYTQNLIKIFGHLYEIPFRVAS